MKYLRSTVFGGVGSFYFIRIFDGYRNFDNRNLGKKNMSAKALFLRYSVLDNGFFCPSLLARTERRIYICLQRRKCLKKHTNFVKYANHEVTEFWACKKWARTVLAFLSLQKIEWKLVNSSNVKYMPCWR